MEYLDKGKYYGVPNKVINLGDIVLTDNEYVHKKVDWHYHENAYFTYLIKGRLQEINKKETFNCNAGTLLFHNCQDAHYNIKPDGFTRGFQLEFSSGWLHKHDFKTENFEGSGIICDIELRNIFNNIYIESVLNDNVSAISIEALLTEFFTVMNRQHEISNSKLPSWLKTVESILTEETEMPLTLENLSERSGVHPVHISRMFPKYYGTTIGNYIRKIKINKAIDLIFNSELSLTQISAACGFSDQSHFIRVFRAFSKTTPQLFRKTLKN
ncbi:MAG: helix-turn-helix transcriptional regulator [Ignavibacteria bacterium]|nr:helix-turn-helix transcriptional regulator [Ignavibacteria bacterium]